MSVHLLGIRHHGPGSAKNVKAYLEELKPDIILVEGPPEGESQLKWSIHNEMTPPVALLAYIPDEPQKAVFYPFAEFSPEWQAIIYGTYNLVPIRFFDLPLVHSFALEKEKEKIDIELAEKIHLQDNSLESELPEEEPLLAVKDPFQYLAEIDGVSDGEAWWELNFESRTNNEQIFQAVQESVTALREELGSRNTKREKLREAWMRKMIRTAEKEGYQNIAVICGAWHVPALAEKISQKDDNELLKNLPKVKVETTWVPWTYNRLTFRSGYGAGIWSPGWYHHLWHNHSDDGTLWMSKVAQLLRSKNMDTSVAHVIESVRLANSLAYLRNYSRAGLEEFNEATTAIMSFGDPILLKLITEELIISHKIGQVPGEVPKVPLLTDIEKSLKRLRLLTDGTLKDYTFDLRNPNDLEKSVLLNRLSLLGINYGEQGGVSGKGTFKEQWSVEWQPEFSIKIIEQGVWGNTAAEASSNYLVHVASQQPSITELARYIEKAIPADLPQAVEKLIVQLDQLAANSFDVIELMEALPGISNVSRYGNVRKTDSDMLIGISKAMITRISIGLPLSTVGIDEESAATLLQNIANVNQAVNLLQLQDEKAMWQNALQKIQEGNQTHALISGYSCRLLFDQKILEYEEVARRFSYALSMVDPMHAAYWIEGFLRGSGTILLLDENLWNILYKWIDNLDEEIFTQLLPLLRRTFSEFTSPERRKLGEKAKKGGGSAVIIQKESTSNFNHKMAEESIPIMMQLLGLKI